MKHKEMGGRIRQRRIELDISASDLAAMLKMSKATIHRYENGDIRTIKLPIIESIARDLRCNPAWLVCKSERKEATKDVSGDARYNDIATVFDDVIQHIEFSENLTFNGKRLDQSGKGALLAGLKTIRDIAAYRFEK